MGELIICGQDLLRYCRRIVEKVTVGLTLGSGVHIEMVGEVGWGGVGAGEGGIGWGVAHFCGFLRFCDRIVSIQISENDFNFLLTSGEVTSWDFQDVWVPWVRIA